MGVLYGEKEVFAGTYKAGLAKKETTNLTIYNKYIEGLGTILVKGTNLERINFNIKYTEITDMRLSEKVKNYEAIAIDYKAESGNQTLYLIGFDNPNEVYTVIKDTMDSWLSVINANQEAVTVRREQAERERKRKEATEFYEAAIQFHEENTSSDFYTIVRDDENFIFSGFYFDNNKNLNIVKVDGMDKADMNAIIEGEKVYYYAKSADDHYRTVIDERFPSNYATLDSSLFEAPVLSLERLLHNSVGLEHGSTYSERTVDPESAPLPTTSKTWDDDTMVFCFLSDVKQRNIAIALPVDAYDFINQNLPDKVVENIEEELKTKPKLKPISSNIQVDPGPELKPSFVSQESRSTFTTSDVPLTKPIFTKQPSETIIQQPPTQQFVQQAPTQQFVQQAPTQQFVQQPVTPTVQPVYQQPVAPTPAPAPAPTPAPTAQAAPGATVESFEDKIKKIKLLYDNGFLTEEEFKAEKMKLMMQL